MLVFIALSIATAWVWLALLHGRFWETGPQLPPEGRVQPCRVAVVIPARDEEEHIEATLRSLVEQQLAGHLHILVVDDNSTDRTGALARSVADQDARLSVIAGQPLAPGWTGKMWAVAQGLSHPVAAAADYVLLTDADIRHESLHVAQLVAQAQTHGFDLVSEMVKLRSESFAERSTIPAFVFFFCMLYPFRWVADAARHTAAAAGGTMLLSRAALDRIEGVQRIRAELIDDCALAREVKRGGHRIWLGHATQATSMRAYDGFADVWNMIARTAYVQLRYSPLVLAGTCVALLLLYAAPVALTIAATGASRGLGVAAWAIMALLFQPTLRRYRQTPLWGAALPLIAMFYLAATVGSAARFYRGRGGQWKSRSYPAV